MQQRENPAFAKPARRQCGRQKIPCNLERYAYARSRTRGKWRLLLLIPLHLWCFILDKCNELSPDFCTVKIAGPISLNLGKIRLGGFPSKAGIMRRSRQSYSGCTPSPALSSLSGNVVTGASIMVATLAQAASAAYYLESQRSFRHPNEYYTAGEEPDGGVWFKATLTQNPTACSVLPTGVGLVARSTAATSTGCITASPAEHRIGKLTQGGRPCGQRAPFGGSRHDLQRRQERLGLVGSSPIRNCVRRSSGRITMRLG